MHIKTPKPMLAAGLKTVGTTISNRSTLPVLEHVLLQAEGDVLTLSGTNLTTGLVKQLRCQPTLDHQDGGICVPAKLLTDIVSTMPDDLIDLETLPICVLVVRCGASHVEIKCLDAQEFPPLNKIDRTGGIELKGSALLHMIKLTEFCASPDDTKLINGVSFSVRDGRLTMVATDGYRVSVAIDEAAEELPERIIPVESIRILAKLLAAEEYVYYRAPENNSSRVYITGPDWQFASQLLETTNSFPDYKVINPGAPKTTVIVATGQLRAAVKRAGIVARSGNGIVTLEIRAERDGMPGQVTVGATAEETGNVNTQLDAQVTGLPERVQYNYLYLEDALDSIETPNVEISMKDGRTPTRITGHSKNGYMHLLMPMRLD